MRFSYTHSNTAPAGKLFFSVNNAIEKTPLNNFLIEKDNHLGSVITTLSDRRIGVGTGTISGTIDHYTASILSTSDFYSFGMQMPERTFVGANAYRYSFGGQEVDNEVHNNQNNYTAEYWQYDARLGRRWNVDPIVKPWESGYATFANNPIYYNDPDGLDAKGWLKKAWGRVKEFVKHPFNKAERAKIFNSNKGSNSNNGNNGGGGTLSVRKGEGDYGIEISYHRTFMDRLKGTGKAIGNYFSDSHNFSFGADKPFNFFGLRIANCQGYSWADNAPVESAGVYAETTYKFGHLKEKTEVKYVGTTESNEILTIKTSTELLTSSPDVPELSAGTGLVFKFGPTRSGVVTGNIGASLAFFNFGYNPSTREFKLGVQISTKPVKLTFKPKIEGGVKMPDTELIKIRD